MIVQTMSAYDFVRAFEESDTRKDQFSREALLGLYDYYNELSDSTDEPFEFDMIGICCEWTEYDSAVLAYKEYDRDDPASEAEALDYLLDRTTLLELDNGHVLVMAF